MGSLWRHRSSRDDSNRCIAAAQNKNWIAHSERPIPLLNRIGIDSATNAYGENFDLSDLARLSFVLRPGSGK